MTEEQYLLTCLAEECGEVAHEASKAIRFGPEHACPSPGATNRLKIEQELGDLLGVCDMLGLIPCPQKRAEKMVRVTHFMGISRALGMVE